MKITKERLLEIIKEEVDNAGFGKDAISRSDRAKELRKKMKSAATETGVDTKERGIVQRIEQNLTKLADLTDIKTGSTFTLLNRLNTLMEKEIQKLEGGSKNEK